LPALPPRPRCAERRFLQLPHLVGAARLEVFLHLAGVLVVRRPARLLLFLLFRALPRLARLIIHLCYLDALEVQAGVIAHALAPVVQKPAALGAAGPIPPALGPRSAGVLRAGSGEEPGVPAVAVQEFLGHVNGGGTAQALDVVVLLERLGGRVLLAT